jgi:anaerobic magnesium-protoporphyrin IX monomethyl ester cyclase
MMGSDILLAVPVPTFVTRNPPSTPDIGLGYIAAVLLESAFSVSIVDWVPRIDEAAFRKRLRAAKPSVVGLKVFTINFREVRETLTIVRAELPRAILVLGGPHPSTSVPEQLFDEFPAADFFLRGEAEHAFTELCAQLRSVAFDRDRIVELHESLPHVAGLVWRKQGRTTANEPILEDLSKLPFPAWGLLDPNASCHEPVVPPRAGENPHVAPLSTTRGCPYRCSFCCAHLVNGRVARRRPVEDIVAEIKLLKSSFGIDQFVLTDSSFLLDRAFVHDFCDALEGGCLDVRWECIYEVQDDVEPGTALQLFRTIHAAGCRRIAFSPETASFEMIRAVHKNFDPARLARVVQTARSCGLDTLGFFLLGFPNETLEDIRATVNFALATPFDRVLVSLVLPFPGTELLEMLEQRHGSSRVDWGSFDFWRPAWNLSNVPRSVLFREHALANLRAWRKNAPLRERFLSRTAAVWAGRAAYWGAKSMLESRR